ncbi:MAG: histidine--tRNA ligase [Candidatus Aminicenantes bacterium]|nr:histidine--tRNA ligase [Candidatus Aminicenantes bacterium]
MNDQARKKQINAIKGTKDILPDEVWKWQKLEAEARLVFERYGYREIRTPVFEATELFIKGTGSTTDIVTKEMYTFVDKGGRSITLRPEYTPSVVRSIIENRLNLQPQPLRFYFIGPMFRYDKPQKGRYRQFHQIDIEVFGEKDPAIDAEIVEMAKNLLTRMGVTDTDVLVNSVGCQTCRPGYREKLKQKAEESRSRLCPDCQRKIGTNPLRIFDCKVEACKEISIEFPKITDFLCPECDEHFEQFCKYLDAFDISYSIEPRLVRGLDYYTKTTFEFSSRSLGAQDAVLGGGRYDDMMKEFGGPDICGTGFAVGVERLLSIVSVEENQQEWLYLIYLGDEAKSAAMEVARFLRENGVECLVEYRERSLRNQLSRANKLNAAWVLIIGEDEVKKGTFQLKNMKTAHQDTVTKEEILKHIRRTN